MLPPKKCPVAVNCWVSPAAIEAVVGETVMLNNVSAPAGRLVSGSTTPTIMPVTNNVGIRARTTRPIARLSRPNMESPLPHFQSVERYKEG